MSDTQVLIVGAGPTGLTLACDLLRRGVRVRLIDQALEPATTSRAIAVHSRTLEVFEGLGVAEALVARGNRLHDVNAYAHGQRIVRVSFDELDSPYPFVLALSQAETEALLRGRLKDLGGAIERGLTLTGLTQDEGGVTATLARAGGGELAARARFVVGCDGAHSATRKAMGLPFSGDAFEERFLLADVRLEWGLPDDELHVFFSEDGPLVVAPMPDDRKRVIASLPPEDGGEGDAGAAPTLAQVQALLDERGPAGASGAKASDLGWTSRFTIHERLVPEYRRGRVLLAGDAAHVHSPVGGQGMNTGIQDAVNLAWKLALVAQGRAADRLLDSYHLERRAVAEGVVRATGMATQVATLRNPVARGLRDGLAAVLGSFEVVQRRAARQASGVAIDYAGSPIVGEARASLLSARMGGPPGEDPRVSDWLQFSAAPGPGARAPDAPALGATGQEVRLRSLFHGTGFALLLFDGEATTEDGYRTLEQAARDVVQRAGDLVRPYVVVPLKARPAPLHWDGPVLLDPHFAVHHRYGATAECLYLIRPDGYVGFRAQPAQADALMAHLDALLGAPPGA